MTIRFLIRTGVWLVKTFYSIVLMLVLYIGSITVIMDLIFPLVQVNFFIGLFAGMIWVYAFWRAGEEIVRLRQAEPKPPPISNDSDPAAHK